MNLRMQWMAGVMRYGRWVCELLTSLYFSVFVIGRETPYFGSWPFTWLEASLRYFDGFLAHWRGGRLFFPRIHVYAGIVWAMCYLLAITLFVCIRLVSLVDLGRNLLDYLLITTLVAVPLFTPVAEGQHLQASGLYAATDEGHLILLPSVREAEVALLLLFLYAHLLRFRNWPKQLLVSLLTAHFVFWSLIIVGRDWPQLGPEVYIVTLLPLIASLMWALYTKHSANWVFGSSVGQTNRAK